MSDVRWHQPQTMKAHNLKPGWVVVVRGGEAVWTVEGDPIPLGDRLDIVVTEMSRDGLKNMVWKKAFRNQLVEKIGVRA